MLESVKLERIQCIVMWWKNREIDFLLCCTIFQFFRFTFKQSLMLYLMWHVVTNVDGGGEQNVMMVFHRVRRQLFFFLNYDT